MVRRDYQLLTDVLANHRRMYGGRTDSVAMEIVNDLADALAQDNKAFDKDKFINDIRGE